MEFPISEVPYFQWPSSYPMAGLCFFVGPSIGRPTNQHVAVFVPPSRAAASGLRPDCGEYCYRMLFRSQLEASGTVCDRHGNS